MGAAAAGAAVGAMPAHSKASPCSGCSCCLRDETGEGWNQAVSESMGLLALGSAHSVRQVPCSCTQACSPWERKLSCLAPEQGAGDRPLWAQQGSRIRGLNCFLFTKTWRTRDGRVIPWSDLDQPVALLLHRCPCSRASLMSPLLVVLNGCFWLHLLPRPRPLILKQKAAASSNAGQQASRCPFIFLSRGAAPLCGIAGVLSRGLRPAARTPQSGT